MTLDGAKVEVIRRYILSATEEVRRTLIRTAFNPGICEVHDFGISIYDSNRELIAEAPGLAQFLGANDTAIHKAIDYIGVEGLEPGDVVLMNYPYRSSAHVSDVTLYAGVFGPEDARWLIAYICIRAHWADLGAKDVGYVLDSTDMHQEGLAYYPGTEREKRAGTFRAAVQAGEQVTVLSAGGAGYGNPMRRATGRVLHDVLEGYVTETAAREIYRIAIKNGEIDHTASSLLRGSEGRVA